MVLVEYVANVSEGRRPDSVERLSAAAMTPDARLLDTHSDADHNRSVFTLVCKSARAAVDSAVALASACLESIEIAPHEGVHPRLGALDVCPFVQLDPTGGPDARFAALRAGEEIAALGVPVFFYDDASPARHRLPDIRRGAFSDIAPDAGPRAPHPTGGATAVGLRPLLVAYNITIDTEDAGTAARIARAVRETEGGPPGLRALALWLPGARKMQISMNLTRPSMCGVGTAWRTVEAEARELGVDLEGGELVGLVPRGALLDAEPEILARSDIGENRILENAMADAGLWPAGLDLPLDP